MVDVARNHDRRILAVRRDSRRNVFGGLVSGGQNMAAAVANLEAKMNKKVEELEQRKRRIRDDLGTEAIEIVKAALNYQLLPGQEQIERFSALYAKYEKAQQDYTRELYSDEKQQTEANTNKEDKQ
jgi:hypothetical protein